MQDFADEQDEPRRTMHRWRRLWPIRLNSLSTKLYCVAILSIIATSGLAAASIYFAKTTEKAAQRLYGDGFVGVISSTRLELFLEQHRRIVESMPAEVDRERLDQSRTRLNEIGTKLTSLMNDLIAEQGNPASDDVERQIADSFAPLFQLGDRVAFYAINFAQDKALEFADQYAAQADKTQQMIRRYREQRLQAAHESLSGLTNSANSLIVWVWICTIAAFVLIGPAGLTITHGVVSRLGRITNSMIALAKHDTSVAIPSCSDRDEVGDMARAVEVFKDNAIQLIAREIDLQRVNHRLDVALNNMTHGLCMFDAERRLIVCNATYIRMYDLPGDLSEPGTPCQRINEYRVKIGNNALASPEQVAAESAAETGQGPSAFTHELVDGRVIAISQQPMPDGGWVAVHEDITERRRSEAKIAHLARHDVVTGLPNRVMFREHLEQAFASLQAGRSFSVLCLDLDHFKQVNDTLGHPIGDRLLQAVATRLTACVEESDLVARIGGDEFAIVQRAVERPEKSSRLASRIVDAISTPFDIEGKHVVIGTSIGIAIAPADGRDPDQLLKNADMALYLAKTDGRNTHRFFEAEMDRRLQARRALELDLRAAIVNGDFELRYQPIVKLDSGAICGFEALIRWNNGSRGQILPSDFIALAEETGLVLPIGEWVLRTACSQAVAWPDAVTVAVNLSPAQFKSQNLVQVVLNALATSGLAPGRLELEITESVLLQNEANTLSTLHQLRALGVRIAMDDFGTGYSSLAYVRSFPFDKIKIDRSFVSDMTQREESAAIVRAVAGLARSLDIITVVEGIETQQQLDMARAEGCDEGQGYLFGRPQTDTHIPALLRKRNRVASAA
jgi:diguanylate cyclase (GGDEF)-like protein